MADKKTAGLILLVLVCGLTGFAFADTKAIGLEEAIQQLPGDLQTPNRYALVIGVGQYEDSRIPKLIACPNDARQLYDVLINPSSGFFPSENVTLLLDQDVTRNRVVDGLDRLGRKAGKEDLVVIFFSGHGAVDEKGRSYWVMHNSRIDRLRATALAETEITELLSEIKTNRLVTLIDACYSASTAELGKSKSLVDLQKIYPEFTGNGRVAITASKGDQLSVVISDTNHPGKGYSAFSWHLVSAMKGRGDLDKDGVVTVDELWDYVKDRTAVTARQQGGNQQPQLKGQIGSKFLLTVDSQRLVENTLQISQSLNTLRQFGMDKQMSLEQYYEAEKLIKTDPTRLSDTDRQKRQVYLDMAEGRLTARYLQAALDAIETPAQRAARLEREANERSEREKQAKIEALLSRAHANDNKTDGRRALEALGELLELDPSHSEAINLQEKIRGYYGPHPGDVVTNSIGMKLLWIPPGEFMMGSNLSPEEIDRKWPGGKVEWYKDEHPRHRVTLTKGFYMGITEVTRGQFVRFVRETGYRTDAEKKGIAWALKDNKWGDQKGVDWQNPLYNQTDEHPVVCISHNDAVAFCEWLSKKENKRYRLPTEAEWEYACRSGSDTTVWWWGNNESGAQGCANVAGEGEDLNWDHKFKGVSDGYTYTAPAGSFSPNAYGLYDMIGNAWEWCSDWYGDYPSGSVADPVGPTTGSGRVLRGGSWNLNPWFCRSAVRFRNSPVSRHGGFRVVVLDF